MAGRLLKALFTMLKKTKNLNIMLKLHRRPKFIHNYDYKVYKYGFTMIF